jgi:mRNA-degrading endonuclease RelE of RelBE toxin-antitoxin system
MDEIEKFLALLGKKERGILSGILNDVRSGNLHGYNVKPFKGYKGFFRLRKGKIRIVFAKTEQGSNLIVNVAYRKDAYKDL